MKKSIVSILLAKAPPPGKLGKSEEDEHGGDGSDEMDSHDEGDDGNDAAGESATGDFIAAIHRKNPVAAWKAFKEMCSLCEDYEGEEDDGADDYGG